MKPHSFCGYCQRWTVNVESRCEVCRSPYDAPADDPAAYMALLAILAALFAGVIAAACYGWSLRGGDPMYGWAACALLVAASVGMAILVCWRDE